MQCDFLLKSSEKICLKSLGQAFSKACGFQRQSLWSKAFAKQMFYRPQTAKLFFVKNRMESKKRPQKENRNGFRLN